MTAIERLSVSTNIAGTPQTVLRQFVLFVAVWLNLCGTMPFEASAIAQEITKPNERVDFSRDIRPILSNHCFQCHGADEDSRAADLRLDVRESAVQQEAINSQDLLSSHLLNRITSTDPLKRMPPT